MMALDFRLVDNETILLGIDPGLDTTGYAILSSTRDGASVIEGGTICTNHKIPLPDRLAELFLGLEEILAQFKPFSMGIEQVFSHFTHPGTVITMAHARGVLLLAAARSKITVKHFLPTKVKKCLTGSGRAGKLQVQRAVAIELGLNCIPDPPDVADAMAVAFCLHQTRLFELRVGQ